MNPSWFMVTYLGLSWFIFFMTMTILVNQPLIINSSDAEIKNTLKLLEEGEKEIQFPDHSKSLTLMLGNTGSGKSTVTQWIAGDNSKLIAKEVSEGTGEFIIEDENRIGSSTTVSKTIFPELVLDANHNLTIYYDCPGFSDTRSTSYDIATTYFIKEVADFADTLKIVFVVSYPSVQKGVDRQDFMKLLRHATDFIKDIERFRDSIAMIVTKVNNDYIKQGPNFILVSDEKVTNKIAEFLEEVKEDLVDRFNQPVTSEKEKAFCKNAIKFIEILRLKTNKHYPRIGLFRRPDKPGPLSNIALLQDGKRKVQKILYENLDFTSTIDHEFGYTVSDRSKNDISALTEEINKIIWENLNEIVYKSLTYYTNISQKISNSIKLLITTKEKVYTNETEAYQYVSYQSAAGDVISSLLNEVNSFNDLSEFADKNENYINRLDVSNQVQNILTQGKYFNFLQTVSDRKLQIGPFNNFFEQLDKYLHQNNLNIEKDAKYAVQQVRDKIKINIKIIAKGIDSYYMKKMNRLDIETVPAELSKGSSNLTNLAEDISDGQNIEQKINEYLIRLDIINFGIRQSVSAISNLEQNLGFLNILTFNDISYTDEWNLGDSLYKVAQDLSESTTFYKFLNSLYARFSEFDIQKDTTLYNVANIQDWGNPGKSQGIYVTRDNFDSFLLKLNPYNLVEYNAVKNITVTDSHLNTMNNLLTLTLKNTINFDCSQPGRLVIRGDFIKFSDFVDKNGNVISKCKTGSNFDSVDIFATNIIFIDADLQGVGSKIKLSTIAPKWRIVSSRKITLDGSPGKVHQYSKARDAIIQEGNGSDGLPGNPGGAAGNFFGIGSTFKNIQYLTISANGGQGGTGQDGGNGAQGAKGEDAYIDGKFNRKLIEDKGLCVGYMSGWGCSYTKFYEYYGLAGRNGGNGGNGGVEGEGGKHGLIKIWKLNNNVGLPQVKSNQGNQGKYGKGGWGGSGGLYGNDIIAECISTLAPFSRIEECTIQSTSPSTKTASSGTRGADGQNKNGLTYPEQAVAFQNIADVTGDYKAYLRENMQNQFKRQQLMQFVKQIDTNYEMKNSYNTLELVNDLLKLEKQVYSLQNLRDDDVMYFYETLLSNILYNAARVPRQEKQQILVLSNLYTATLSKISSLKLNINHQLIIDLERYLDIVQQDIKTLRNVNEKNNKVRVIDQYRNEYKSAIDEKISEAMNLIQEQIMPEIERINIQLEQRVDQLINETIILLDQANSDKEKLVMKKQELQNALVASWIFSSIKIFSQVLGCFGGPAAAIASTINNVLQITEPLILEDYSRKISTIELTNGVVSNFENGIENIKNQKFNSFGATLGFIDNGIKEYQEELDDTLIFIENIETRYQSALNSSNSMEINVLENEMKGELTRKELELKSSGVEIDERTQDIIKTIERFNHVVEFGQIGVDIYSKIQSDKRAIREIDEAIKEADRKIQSLKQYTIEIYDTLIPVLMFMENDLRRIAGQLEKKSKVALDVQKCQVQSSLRDMKLQLKQFTKGFKVEEDLARSIEKLEEAMTTLVDIYDRIENYQEQKLLADYIADISSAGANNINIADPKLRQAVNDLEIVIRSNLVLQRYDTAVGALKQQVFPMANFYLSEPLLPPSLALESNFQNLVTKAIKQVESIRTKTQEYKASITKIDRYISKGWFNSKFVSSKPFFVWENTQYKGMIHQLLSGEKVVINSNVLSSDFDKDSIKFNEIGINFTSFYPNISSDIQNTLKGFKVSATHLGNSYYRYNDDIYVIISDSQNIQFSFETDLHGKPIHTNRVYDKIKEGDLMLSPYAMWEIQLINTTNRISFGELQKYTSYVDIELVGYGNYLTKGTVIPEVDSYYKLDEPYFST